MASKPEEVEWDAIVVGSGCTGGTAAMVLSRRGLKVLVLEAGPRVTPEQVLDRKLSSAQHLRRFWRGFVSNKQASASRHPGFWYQNPDLFLDDSKHPYSHPADKPFHWIRGRQLGGKSHTWGGVAPRWSRYEFETPRRDGYASWPLAYEELVPYFEMVERSMPIYGQSSGLDQLPDQIYAGSRPFTPGEKLFASRVARKWPDRRLVMAPGALATPGDDGNPWPRRSVLAGPMAIADTTGLTTTLTGVVVRHVDFAPSTGKATGVIAIDAASGEEIRLRGRLVVLCASTIESVRILLNSRDGVHESGPGNQSGLLGRCLMDHVITSQHFFLPVEGDEDTDTLYPMGGPDSVLIPRWCNLESRDQDFAGGFGFWGAVQRDVRPEKKPGYVSGVLMATGEMLPNSENRIELDPTKTDVHGIPVVNISCEFKENDLKVREACRTALDEILSETGAEPREPRFLNPLASAVRNRIDRSQYTPGWYIHELGGAQMGERPDDSVVNSHCQVWGAENLLVVDGAAWPASGWANPTLTMMAIAARACTHASEELMRREL